MLMMEEVLEFLRGKIKRRNVGYVLNRFEILEPNQKIFAVDSGYRKVFDTGRGGVYLIKFGHVTYLKDRRIENSVKETIVYISEEEIEEFGGFLDEKDKKFFEAKIWDFINNRGLDYEISEKIVIGGISRLLELREGRELDGIILFDFPFDFRFEIHKEEFEKIRSKKVGLAKRSRLKGFQDVLFIRKEGRWYIEACEGRYCKDFFVKYGESLRSIPFRTSVEKEEDHRELFGILSYYSDETKKGYLYPLIRIDKLVRVREGYARRIRRIISSEFGELFDVMDIKF